MHIETIVGQGPESVYVFNLPSQYNHHGDYPCKIGRTGRDNVRKRLAEYQAGMQEEPVVGLVIRCDDSQYLERDIHKRLADKKLPTYGNEWYNTTPDGVLAIYWELQKFTDLTLHDQVRRARSLLDLTQADLAERAGISVSQLSALEQGFDVKVSALVEVARELGLRLVLDAR